MAAEQGPTAVRRRGEHRELTYKERWGASAGVHALVQAKLSNGPRGPDEGSEASEERRKKSRRATPPLGKAFGVGKRRRKRWRTGKEKEK